MKRLILLMCLPLIAAADQETKLVVKLEKAQRAVEISMRIFQWEGSAGQAERTDGMRCSATRAN